MHVSNASYTSSSLSHAHDATLAALLFLLNIYIDVRTLKVKIFSYREQIWKKRVTDPLLLARLCVWNRYTVMENELAGESKKLKIAPKEREFFTGVSRQRSSFNQTLVCSQYRVSV